MLEFFRKHKGAFMITLTVIIIISFSVWGGFKGKEDPRASSGSTAFTLYGKDYTMAEFQRMRRSTQLIYMLQLFDLFGLSDIARDPAAQGQDFIFNLLVLKHEMEKAGIHPTNAQAEEELKKLSAFQENGTFSQQRAQSAEANLGMMGMSGQDMLDIVKLKIGFTKLQDLIGKNYVPSPVVAEKEYAKQYQTLKISTIPFLLDDFKKDIKISDEEIKKYFEENKDTYKTIEKRAVSYVFFENPKDLDKKPLEERQALEKKATEAVNKFTDQMALGNTDLTKIAAHPDIKMPVQTLPLFAKAEVPEAIKGERELIDAIFRFDKSIRTISDAIKGTKGFYVFTVTQVEEPKQQELSAVKDKIKDTLTSQKAREAMSKAVNDARTALSDGLKAGKKIEDLAKDKKLTLSPVKELEPSQPAMDIPDADRIAPKAAETPAGQLTEVIEGAAGATLVYVNAKELRKRDDSASLRKNSEEGIASTDRNRLFEAWFSRKREAAGFKMHIEAPRA
jgi:hypothetical protein